MNPAIEYQFAFVSAGLNNGALAEFALNIYCDLRGINFHFAPFLSFVLIRVFNSCSASDLSVVCRALRMKPWLIRRRNGSRNELIRRPAGAIWDRFKTRKG